MRNVGGCRRKEREDEDTCRLAPSSLSAEEAVALYDLLRSELSFRRRVEGTRTLPAYDEKKLEEEERDDERLQEEEEEEAGQDCEPYLLPFVLSSFIIFGRCFSLSSLHLATPSSPSPSTITVYR